MVLPLTLLIISLLGLALLIGHKMWELERGTHERIHSWRERGDRKAQDALMYVRSHIDTLSQYEVREIARAFGLKGIEKASMLKRELEKRLREKDGGVVGMVRGKRKIKRRNVQSEYLRDISEHKNNNKAPEDFDGM